MDTMVAVYDCDLSFKPCFHVVSLAYASPTKLVSCKVGIWVFVPNLWNHLFLLLSYKTPFLQYGQ